MDLLNDLEGDTKQAQQQNQNQDEMILTGLDNELPKATPNFDEGPVFDIELRSDLREDDDDDLNKEKTPRLLSSNGSLDAFNDMFNVGKEQKMADLDQ